ncbi:MAG: hypothetical protein COV59_04835 [Candidatus Magasanikbacteria bacterium CG11_big_fil_rev_8_21_14_0_20_39_34]|uniref:VanZ-like domain-containing protein n=1 Tax=Candidatus Magasanikbacteria bacterium CG11_big_fil_rev_8_21_14_0_20_39_34 TaxID=1974653 RepID=A0A2H0N467_9BACT|nr:MAG: hypothetical protein COV59_04835 [Candidatus Magasanikbacteria bacterium CG11_big_fil_rev_8_21_14_0_20_39_34]
MKKLSWKDIGWAFWPPTVVFLVHTYLVYAFHITTFFPNFDMFAHLAGGMAIGYTASRLEILFQEKALLNIKSAQIRFFLILCVVSLFAICWEFHEFLLDTYWGSHMQEGLLDTMEDMFFGLFGGGIFAFFLFMKQKREVYK